MAANTEALTISFQQIQSIPFSTRQKMMDSGYATYFAAQLTPSQQSTLFPKYYERIVTDDKLTEAEQRLLRNRGIGGGTGAGTGGGTGPRRTPSVSARDLPPEAQAFLNTISSPGLEGAGYNTIVGGGAFEDYSRHPGVVGYVGPHGASTAAGRYQITQTTWRELQERYPELGDFSPENQDRAAWYLAQDRYRAYTGGRDLLADLGSNDPQVLNTVFTQLSQTWTSLPSGLEEGTAAGNVLEMYTDNLESIHRQLETASLVSVNPENMVEFYDQLKEGFPDLIDPNSPIWDLVDPVLRENIAAVVDNDTGFINRDTLLAADATMRVLRNNGYTPRIPPGGGGDDHSQNHGAHRDANYAIDIAAIDSDGNLVRIGTDMPESIKQDMAAAATLTSPGSMRIGYPLADSSNSMHIQANDPDQPAALWGYTNGPGSSTSAALQGTSEGQRFMANQAAIQSLSAEERAERLNSLAMIPVVPTAPPASVVTAGTPVATASPAANIFTASGSTEADVIPNAQGGSYDISKPYIASPVDGDGPRLLMGEAGKENLTITPQHKVDAESVGAPNESYQERAKEGPAKEVQPQATQPIIQNKIYPSMNPSGYTSGINTSTPGTPPTFRKAMRMATNQDDYTNPDFGFA